MTRPAADPRRALLRRLPKRSVGAEIGVYEGDFSAQILGQLRPRSLHLIDPWRYEAGPRYEQAWYGGGVGASQARMDAVHAAVLERFAPEIAAGVVVVHRAPSIEAAAGFADGYFDWVYIDGNHLYEFVKADLETYHRKVRTGGHIAGDDYGAEGWWAGGVTRAVDEFRRSGLCETVLIQDRQFLLRKV